MARPKIKEHEGRLYFFRFTLNQRIQHVILFVCVILLVLTGMPLKFHDQEWAAWLYRLFGGIDAAPIVHRVTGAVLLTLFAYHLGYLARTIWTGSLRPLKRAGELNLKSLIKTLITQPLVPSFKDAKDILALVKYLLYLSPQRPEGERFTWKEKADYLAPFWGIAVIGGTGAMMWNLEATTRVLPGWALNYALIAHSEEALLAALFLFMWHWYNVHFSVHVFPMSSTFITGYMSEELMIEEHYLQYVSMMNKAGMEDRIKPMHGSEPDAPPLAEPGGDS
jgi:cytochrome b subunit of formate dehydrogenase